MTHGICSPRVCIGGENITQPGNAGRQRRRKQQFFPSINWVSQFLRSLPNSLKVSGSIASSACTDISLRTLSRLRMPLKHLSIHNSCSFQKFTLELLVCQNTSVDEVSRAHSLSLSTFPLRMEKEALQVVICQKSCWPWMRTQLPLQSNIGECNRIGECHREQEHFSFEGCWERTRWEERWLLEHSQGTDLKGNGCKRLEMSCQEMGRCCCPPHRATLSNTSSEPCFNPKSGYYRATVTIQFTSVQDFVLSVGEQILVGENYTVQTF